jgi:valyl-tRNA synthetase
MIMLSLYNMDGIPPFNTVYLHGLVRGADGKKMSKSTGNIVDPLEAIETYGCDGLRYALISGTSPGNDQKLTDDRLESGRNFANKLWNAGRFVISLSEQHKDKITTENSKPALEDVWISSRLAELTEEVDRLLTNYELSEALRQIRDFFWDDFADWYLEIAKIRIRNEDYRPLTVLTESYEMTLRLVHPFMPFISEEIWQRLQNSISSSGEQHALIVASYPSSQEINSKKETDALARFGAVQEFIRSIRNIRSENKVDAARKIECFIVTTEYTDEVHDLSAAITSMARVDPLHVVSDINQAPGDQVVSHVTNGGTVIVPLGGLFDLEIERKRLQEDLQTAHQEIKQQNQKLDNQEFRKKAPERVVQKELDKLEAAKVKAANISDRLQELVTS